MKMRIERQVTALACALLLGAAAVQAQGTPASAAASTSRADADRDPVLHAMLEELDRSKQQLQLQNFEKPFFIQYRLDDEVDYQSSASYGALLGDQEQHRRAVRVTVRVGDYKTDSSSTRGDGSLEVTAVDNDPVALRTSLWAATDSAYKAALRDFTQKQAALRSVQTPPEADDFSHEKPLVWIGPLKQLEIQRDEWRRRVAETAALYRTDPEAKTFEDQTLYSNAQVSARVLNRYLVNSEGTITRQGWSGYQAVVAVGAQAADGMHLDRSYASTATSADQLDGADKFTAQAKKLLLSLRDLRNAPVVTEEYHGPVLLSGDAASDVINDVFAGPVAASRPELGTSSRTRGPYASSYQARVMPDFMSVSDNPLQATFQGKGLVGAYAVDDEGVAAQAVPLVASGKLANYLTGREPIKDFPSSNGHGRAAPAGAPHAHAAVLEVKSAEPLSSDALNAKLMALAKDQGVSVVYYAETLGGELRPRLLYRIHVADGKRELVRGAAFDDLDQRTLRSSIAAAGSDTFLDNVMSDVPTTVLSPSLLISDATVKRAVERNEKLPYYPPPD
jgi:TldD protein